MSTLFTGVLPTSFVVNLGGSHHSESCSWAGNLAQNVLFLSSTSSAMADFVFFLFSPFNLHARRLLVVLKSLARSDSA